MNTASKHEVVVHLSDWANMHGETCEFSNISVTCAHCEKFRKSKTPVHLTTDAERMHMVRHGKSGMFVGTILVWCPGLKRKCYIRTIG